MRELLLVGASGLAREALAVVRRLDRHDEVSVLDDDPRTWGRRVCAGDDAVVAGGIDEVVDRPDADLVICIGSGAGRHRVADRLAALGVADHRYATIVHPSADVPPGCTVGPGSILLAQVVLTANVLVRRHAVLMPHVTLTHDDQVGDHATLCAGVALGGSVVVGDGAYLGMRAAVRERVSIGAGATVGMGAVVLGDVPSGEVWAGVPARRLAVPTLTGAHR
ncbi:acetyltransferase [Nocardioides dongxiaopingii]|uniref:acetyltransferase n=1 Tax=Nocardioides sp. S-1144 TaxID=2582905 RepID=UPI0011631EBA|nr:acetyltransferase [Nocardioides sp. S-1144]QCW50800.2 acetyltransferase [Nocardioides sp. S-1144]